MSAHKVIARALTQGVEELFFATPSAFPYAGEIVIMVRIDLDETELSFAPAGVVSEYMVVARVWGAADRMVIRTYERSAAYLAFTETACDVFVRSVRSAREDIDPRAASHPLHVLYRAIVSGQLRGGVSLAKATDPVSPLCPDVWGGCSHTMVQNGEGVGVACAEWADAHGIEWRVSSASVEGGAF